MSELKKIHSADIEPRGGFHYLILDGKEAARYHNLETALTDRDLFLGVHRDMEPGSE